MDLKLDEARGPLMLTVNRTDAIDGMMDSIRTLRNRPLATPPVGYLDQMRALRRRTRVDTRGRPVREYLTTGPAGDDYAHAETYDLIATELWRTQQHVRAQLAEPVQMPDEALGFRRVRLSVAHEDWQPGLSAFE